MASLKQLVVIFLFCLSAGQTSAKELKIIFSLYTPPYVFEDGTGIVVDIVRTALADKGHTITPVYVPIERGFKMFSDKEVDGTTIIQESSGLNAYYSVDFMQYFNRAFSLKSRNLVIRKPQDLRGKSVIAFQNADKYLGADFAAAVKGNPGYKELARQDSQTFMVLDGRVDVGVMDESIFKYYRQKLISEGKVSPSAEYNSAELFPPTAYKAAFTDEKLRDDFNTGLATMKADGRYEAIYKKYEENYFRVPR